MSLCVVGDDERLRRLNGDDAAGDDQEYTLYLLYNLLYH